MEGKATASVGLTLFPPPPSKKKPARNFSTRFHAPPAQLHDAEETTTSNTQREKSPETMDGRQSAMSGRLSMLDGRSQSALDNHRQLDTVDDRASAVHHHHHHHHPYVPAAGPSTNPFIRSHTSFSDAPTLVRSSSNASHSSTAKPKLSNGPEQPMIRSIFPRYDPEIPLTRQPYFPTQASPTHIPRNAISKSPYSPGLNERVQGLRSPMSAPATVTSFARSISGQQDAAPKTLPPSSTEELKELWKVLNGWRVSASEGRSFVLKLESAVDLPLHTLSSSTQPFYTLRLDPTSTSALVTLSRADPYKGKSVSPKLGARSRSSSPPSASGLEVLRTTLEESARRLPPNDGLVALLYPEAAANMALDLSSKPHVDASQVMAQAEHECARLVWDDDIKTYYLCHPAMPTPFSVQIEASPAWSRVEYTLEHPALRDNLVKLTRDGSGGGYLEVSTAVAAQIDSFYIVDVAVCAVLLVALQDEDRRHVERFEAPPTLGTPRDRASKAKSVMSVQGVRSAFAKKAPKVEEMELDLESQDSLKDTKEKLPAPTRGVLGLLFVLFRFIVWLLTLVVKVLAKLIIGVSTCLTKA